MMRFNVFKNTVLLFVLVMISCGNLSKTKDDRQKTEDGSLVTKTKHPKPKTKQPK